MKPANDINVLLIINGEFDWKMHKKTQWETVTHIVMYCTRYVVPISIQWENKLIARETVIYNAAKIAMEFEAGGANAPAP